MRVPQAAVTTVSFCDVDSIFQHYSSTSLARAARALQRADAAGIAVVLCSARTRVELEHIRAELGLRHPFVVEGGAAAFVPHGYFGANLNGSSDIAGYHTLEFGAPYVEVVRMLRDAANRVGVALRGFSEMSVEDVARDLGIGLLRAQLAKLRDYVEPFRILDAAPEAGTRLTRALQMTRLRTVRRGRYEYTGAFPGLVPSVNALRALYRKTFGSIQTIGQVDASGDERLFDLVDFRVDVSAGENADGLDVTQWAEAICDVVQEMCDTRGGSTADRSAGLDGD